MTRFIVTSYFLLMAGCAHRIFPAFYQTKGPFSKAAGSVVLADFRYLPNEEGQLKPNEIKTTSPENIYLDSPVSNFVKTAVRTELTVSGMNLDKGATLTGKIKTYSVDDLGFSADVYVDIEYTVLKEGKTCFTATVSTHEKVSKYDPMPAILSSALKSNIVSLISKQDFLRCAR